MDAGFSSGVRQPYQIPQQKRKAADLTPDMRKKDAEGENLLKNLTFVEGKVRASASHENSTDSDIAERAILIEKIQGLAAQLPALEEAQRRDVQDLEATHLQKKRRIENEEETTISSKNFGEHLAAFRAYAENPEANLEKIEQFYEAFCIYATKEQIPLEAKQSIQDIASRALGDKTWVNFQFSREGPPETIDTKKFPRLLLLNPNNAYFNPLLTSYINKGKPIELKEIDGKYVDVIFDFLSNKQQFIFPAGFDAESLFTLIEKANRFFLPGLVALCDEMLVSKGLNYASTITLENAQDAYAFAADQQLPTLQKEAALRFKAIGLQPSNPNFKEYIVTDEFFENYEFFSSDPLDIRDGADISEEAQGIHQGANRKFQDDVQGLDLSKLNNIQSDQLQIFAKIFPNVTQIHLPLTMSICNLKEGDLQNFKQLKSLIFESSIEMLEEEEEPDEESEVIEDIKTGKTRPIIRDPRFKQLVENYGISFSWTNLQNKEIPIFLHFFALIEDEIIEPFSKNIENFSYIRVNPSYDRGKYLQYPVSDTNFLIQAWFYNKDFPRLKSINIHDMTSVHEKDVSTRCPNLTEITIQAICINHEALADLANGCKGIEKIHISTQDHNIFEAGGALPNFKSLKSLTLEDPSDQDTEALIAQLPALKSLQVLILPKQMFDKYLERLATAAPPGLKIFYIE